MSAGAHAANRPAPTPRNTARRAGPRAPTGPGGATAGSRTLAGGADARASGAVTGDNTPRLRRKRDERMDIHDSLGRCGAVANQQNRNKLLPIQDNCVSLMQQQQSATNGQPKLAPRRARGSAYQCGTPPRAPHDRRPTATSGSRAAAASPLPRARCWAWCRALRVVQVRSRPHAARRDRGRAWLGHTRRK